MLRKYYKKKNSGVKGLIKIIKATLFSYLIKTSTVCIVTEVSVHENLQIRKVSVELQKKREKNSSHFDSTAGKAIFLQSL